MGDSGNERQAPAAKRKRHFIARQVQWTRRRATNYLSAHFIRRVRLAAPGSPGVMRRHHVACVKNWASTVSTPTHARSGMWYRRGEPPRSLLALNIKGRRLP